MIKNKTLFLPLLFALVLGSCGPANSKKNSGDLNAADPVPTIGATRVSAAKNFYVYLTHRANRVAVGDNQYLLRVVSTKDLSLSQSAVVTGRALMADMAPMDLDIARQADGSFLVSVFYSMPGAWQLDLKIQDGGTSDEYVLNENVQ